KRSGHRFAVQENASKQKARAPVPIQIGTERALSHGVPQKALVQKALVDARRLHQIDSAIVGRWVLARVLSVDVGLQQDVTWQGKTVRSAIGKAPVDGPRMVRRLNIDGDGQGDLAGHGGEHRAVMVYQIESYRYWQNHFGRGEYPFGQFGENFTVEGL